MKTHLALLVLLICVSSTCAKDDITKELITSKGKERAYYLYVPSTIKGPAPLIVMLHGSGRTGVTLVEKWKDYAKKENIIIAGPDATNLRGWGSPQDGPDFLHDLVEELKTKYPINPRRVYLFGHSAGASLVAILVSHPNFVKATGGNLAGAFITSGQYEFKAPHPYAGDDPAKVAEVNAVEGMKKTDIPLFFTRAEWDMPSQMQQGDMIDKTLTAAGKEHGFHLMSGHNHMSQVYSIGTNETQLSDRMLAFIQKYSGNVKAAAAK